MIRYIYRHSHECSLKNELYESRPQVTQGIAYVVHPVCVETLLELELVTVHND